MTIFSLFYNDYTFIGIIAYDSEGDILHGLMLGESEGGSQVRYYLKSNLEKKGDSLVVYSDYFEKYYTKKGVQK